MTTTTQAMPPSPAVTAARNVARPRQSRALNDQLLGWLLLLPAVLLLALAVVYPVARLLHDSLFDIQLSGAAPLRFVGLQNYQDLLADIDARRAAGNTLLITLITVPLSLLAGLLMALGANLNWRRRWPVRLALLLPWALPMAFSGMIFAWFFNSDHGVVNDLLQRLHLPSVRFLLSPFWAPLCVCLATIWKTSSFVALILLAGLQTIPRELHEAAEIDGAGRWHRFWHITLPLLKPSIVVALIFRTVSALQTFDIPYAMTQGGPGHATQTLAMLINTTAVDYLNVGYGSALAVLLFAVSLGISALYLRHVYQEAQ
ncbi:sugar ABC transporter permease [Silvimonas sp. JCM 19000]